MIGFFSTMFAAIGLVGSVFWMFVDWTGNRIMATKVLGVSLGLLALALLLETVKEHSEPGERR